MNTPDADVVRNTESKPLLSVQDIEVVYNGLIAVLKGVSLAVTEGSIVALLGANGAGKTTTLKAISNLLQAERGEVVSGQILFDGQRVEKAGPGKLVRAGMIQVMEGRRCFPHLSIEENLLTGAHTRSVSKAQLRQDLERIYHYFPRLKTRSRSLAGYTSGGEQQMCAIGRALMANPRMLLLDEPSMGLAPQIVEEIFAIVQDLNRREKLSVLIAEQNAMLTLQCADRGYILESGRVMLEGDAKDLRDNDMVREFYLGISAGERRSFADVARVQRRRNLWFSAAES
jgi:branched-chain amino acid transport system ATP-binding protein